MSLKMGWHTGSKQPLVGRNNVMLGAIGVAQSLLLVTQVIQRK